MEPRIHDLDRAGSGRARARKLRLGGPRQYIFLDRPGEGRRRRHPDAADPVRGPQGSGAVRELRESRLRDAGLAGLVAVVRYRRPLATLDSQLAVWRPIM